LPKRVCFGYILILLDKDTGKRNPNTGGFLMGRHTLTTHMNRLLPGMAAELYVVSSLHLSQFRKGVPSIPQDTPRNEQPWK